MAHSVQCARRLAGSSPDHPVDAYWCSRRHDDGGSRKDKRAEHWVRPASRHQNPDVLNEAHMPFDFLELLPFFFVAMALLLERAPTRRNSGALQVNAE